MCDLAHRPARIADRLTSAGAMNNAFGPTADGDLMLAGATVIQSLRWTITELVALLEGAGLEDPDGVIDETIKLAGRAVA